MQFPFFFYICFAWTRGANFVILLQVIAILRHASLSRCKQLIFCLIVPVMKYQMCVLSSSQILLSVLSSQNSPHRINTQFLFLYLCEQKFPQQTLIFPFLIHCGAFPFISVSVFRIFLCIMIMFGSIYFCHSFARLQAFQNII